MSGRGHQTVGANAVVVAFPGTEEVNKPKRRYVRLTDDARNRLREDIAGLGPTPGNADYVALARQYGVCKRTVQNVAAEVRDGDYVRNRDTGRVLTHAVPDIALEAIAAFGGNIHEAHRQLAAAGAYDGSYSQFRRRVMAEHGKNVLLGLRGGQGAMDLRGYRSLQRDAFMQTYSVDLFSLRASVVAGRAVTRPMAALVVEDHTGLVVNHHVFDNDQVNASMVCALLGVAFAGRVIGYTADEDGSPVDANDPDWLTADNAGAIRVGGLVSFVRCDNGSVFVAREVDEALVGFGVRVLTHNAYSPHEGGRHERKHGTARAQLLRMFPTSSDGARNINGELTDRRDMLTLEQARELVAGWVARHNATVDVHGNSPIGRWLQAATGPIQPRYPDSEALAALAHPHHVSVTRSGLGVALADTHFQHPKLSQFTTKRYLAGIWFGDSDHVELWTATGEGTRGTYVGRATDQRVIGAFEAGQLTIHNAREAKVVRDTIASSRELSQRLIAALTPASATAGGHDTDELLDGLETDTHADPVTPAEPEGDADELAEPAPEADPPQQPATAPATTRPAGRARTRRAARTTPTAAGTPRSIDDLLSGLPDSTD